MREAGGVRGRIKDGGEWQVINEVPVSAPPLHCF